MTKNTETVRERVARRHTEAECEGGVCVYCARCYQSSGLEVCGGTCEHAAENGHDDDCQD